MRSLRCALIIVRSGGSRSFRTVVCWPDGICCSANFRLRSSTDRDLSMLMQMAFFVNVASVCIRIGLVSSVEGDTGDSGSTSALLDQPFASSAMGDSVDADLLHELSGETWGAVTYLDDLPPAESSRDLIAASQLDKTLTTIPVSGNGSSRVRHRLGRIVLGCPRSYGLFGNLSIVSEGRPWRRRAPPAATSQLVVPLSEQRGLIHRYYDCIFAGHLGVSRTVYRLLDWVYWPRLREGVRSYLASCSVCIVRKSPCPRRAPLGHISVGTGWPWTFWICRLQRPKVIGTF